MAVSPPRPRHYLPTNLSPFCSAAADIPAASRGESNFVSVLYAADGLGGRWARWTRVEFLQVLELVMEAFSSVVSF